MGNVDEVDVEEFDELLERRPDRVGPLRTTAYEVTRAILMLVERTASQSEVIRAIVSGYSPC